MTRSHLLIACIFWSIVWVLTPSSLRAASWTDRLSDGDVSLELAERMQWPAGTLDLVNDDKRIAGWRFFFSELPNDVYRFGFQCDNAKDINHLITLLAEIEADKLKVLLSPREYGTYPTLGKKDTGPHFAATFAIGCQKIMNEWFERLPIEEGFQRRRVFGVHRYKEVPTATPPTLTVYLGTGHVKMEELRIPAKIHVTSAVGKHLRDHFANDPTAKRIDEYVVARLKQRLSELRQQLREVQAQLDAIKTPTTAPARGE